MSSYFEKYFNTKIHGVDMRPTKARSIAYEPTCRDFGPRCEGGEREYVVLGLDMFEALRLVDGEGLSQDDAARCMAISTPTLCRILSQGRHLVAEALVHGKMLKIEGGNIMITHEDHAERMKRASRHGHGFGHGFGGHGRRGKGFEEDCDRQKERKCEETCASEENKKL